MEITREIAERIINSRALVDQSGVPYKGIEVAYVGYTDSDGEPFVWEDTEEEYAIVSFNAHTPYQLNQAVEEFVAEDFESASNHNLSIRMNVDKARELSKGTPGTLILREVEIDVDGTMEKALLPKSFAPALAIVAKKTSLADMLAKATATAATVEATA